MQIDELMLKGKEATKAAASTGPSLRKQVAEARADGNVLIDLANVVPDPGLGGGLLVVGAIGAAYGAMTLKDFRRRRAQEEGYTGENFSMRDLVSSPPGRGERAHRRNVAAPAVFVANEREPWRTFSSARGVWHTAGRHYDAPHGILVGKTGHGKNDSHLDPVAANVILHRPESAVILDPKGDMLHALIERTPGRRFVYTCLAEHRLSSAINLIATPEMAELTAAALYPTRHERQPFFNLSAAALFFGAAEYLGFGESSVMEVRRLLFDRPKLKELAGENEGIHAVMEGENKKSADEVVGTALLHLDALKFPEVARMFDASPETPQPWFFEKETVWVCFPEAELIGRLAGALFHNLRVRARASRLGAYFLADEAGSVLTLQGIEQCFQTGRGYRTYFLIVLQDLSQMIDRHGRHAVYSILGNAPLKIFGASDDPETREYFSALSATVQVRRRIYEDDGATRAWKQLFSREGAPFAVREETRRGVLGEHVQELPKGSWFVYTGNPREIELVTAPPFSSWKERVLPAASGDSSILGVPRRPDEPEDRGGGAADPEGSEEGTSRKCPGCGHEVPNPDASFCEDCGGRL